MLRVATEDNTKNKKTDFKDILHHLKCEMFTSAFSLECGDVLWVDDIGAHKKDNTNCVFAIPEAYKQPLFGRGLLMGVTPDGDSKDPETALLDFAMMVKWVQIEWSEIT